MKILFVGCIGISRTMLQTLLDNGETVCGIICVPERFKEKTSGYDDLSDIAEKHNIPLFKSRRLHIKRCFEFIKNLEPDLMVVYGWQRIIKPEVLNLTKSVGFHASLLPKYRGSAPVNWAIINGETETGVTMFELDSEVDTGPIFGQKAFPITIEDTCATVYEKSAKSACELILEKLPEWKKGDFKTMTNESENFPVMPRRTPKDGEIINWHMTVKEAYDFIRAQTKPYPGAWFRSVKGTIRLWEAKPEPLTHDINGLPAMKLGPGRFVMVDELGLVIGCKDGNLLVTNYEVENATQS